MVATRMAPIAALAMVLPVVMALAACAPSCTASSAVKVVFDDARVVGVSCADGCDDSTLIEQLGSSADRTWRFTFTGTPPAQLRVVGQTEDGSALDAARLTPTWKTGEGTCAEGWADDLRVPSANG